MTRVEWLAIIGVVILLSSLVVSYLARMRVRSSRIRCINNLKNVGLAYRVFSTDNQDQFPMRISVTNGGSLEFFAEPDLIWRHYLAMSNELSTPKIVICPENARQRIEASAFATNLPLGANAGSFQLFNTNRNISYFVGVDADETKPDMLLAGDRSITNGAHVLLQFERSAIRSLGTNFAMIHGVGWDERVHLNYGNVVFADGHGDQLSARGLRQALEKSGDAQNRIANPE